MHGQKNIKFIIYVEIWHKQEGRDSLVSIVNHFGRDDQGIESW